MFKKKERGFFYSRNDRISRLEIYHKLVNINLFDRRVSQRMEIMVGRYLYILLALLLIPSCTGKQEQKEIVAKVNDRIITLQEFRLFYELDPNFGIDSSGVGALMDELNKYIDQILSYTRAEKMDLLNDQAYSRSRAWETRQATLRELYRQQVQNQITVNDQELRQEYIKGTVQVHIRQLFTSDQEQAESWYDQLMKGGSFQILARAAFRDTLLAKNGGDLGWAPINSLDDDLGNVIQNLQPNEISRPVRSRWGYHIIQLLDRRDQVIITEDEFQRQRSLIEKKIRQRKARLLANQYIATFMGKYNPQPDPAVFRFLWQQIVPKDQQEKKVLSRTFELGAEQIRTVQQNDQGYWNRPLVMYRNGQFTLGEFLEGVTQMPYGNHPRFKSVEQFSSQLGSWVRDELLLTEAKKRDCDREPRVLAEVRTAMEQNFYNLFVEQADAALVIPDTVSQYFRERGKKNRDLSHFYSLEDWRWVQAEKQVHAILREQKNTIWIDRIKIVQESGQINWDRRIRMFMVRQ